MSRRTALARIGGGAAALALAGLQGACRGGGDGGRVSMWSHWTGAQLKAHEDLLQRFRLRHPGVQVESAHVPADFLRVRWMAGLRSGELPDIVLIKSSWLRMRGAKEALCDLSELGAHLRLPERLVRRDYERCLFNERLLALPMSTANGGMMLFHNRAMLREAGLPETPKLRTWDEFVALSTELVRALNPAGAEVERLAWDPFSMAGSQLFVVLALGAGHPPISKDGRSSHIGEPGMLRVFEALDRYVEQVYGADGGHRCLLRWRHKNGSAASISPRHPFVQGRQAFGLTGAWVAGALCQLPERPDFDVAPVPGLDAPHGGIAAHGWAYAMKARPENPEAAWKLLQFLTIETEGNGRLSSQSLRPCPIRSVLDSPDYTAFGEVWEKIRGVMGMDISYPFSIDSDVLRLLLPEYPLRRLRGESLREIQLNFHQRLQASLDAVAREDMQ